MLDKFKWLFRYYRDYPGVVAILLILTPIQGVLQVLVPRLIGFTIDSVKTETVPDNWMARLVDDAGSWFGLAGTESFAVAFIVLGFFSHVMYAYFQSWRAWMNCRLEWAFRQSAFDGLTEKGPDFFNTFRTGDLVTRMTDDVQDKLSWFACSGIFRLYEAVLAVCLIAVMMITIDPLLTLWSAGPLPLLILIFSKSSSALDTRYDRLQRRISSFNDIVEACFTGIRVIKAYVREKSQRASFAGAARRRRAAEIEAVKTMTIIDSLYNYIWQFGVVIVLLAGGYRVLHAELSIGDLATFIYYVVWMVFPMFDIGQFLVKSRQSAVSIGRLQELERVPLMVVDGGSLNGNGVKGSLELERVSFSFPGSEHRILDDVSLQISAGQTVAVVGRVGSGKSWLVNFLPRLVDPTGGSIKLDGRDLRQFTLADLRRVMGYVPQEPVLFSDTVRNNILFGRNGIAPHMVDWAVDMAQFSDDVRSFPKGLDTPIGTRGMSISGGQKQRLGLARALVSKPKVLILDDCTSALDSRTETALWERLQEVMPSMTAILITHRPDTLERADNIFVLDEGRVAEVGTHDDLMHRDGFYARIYRRYQLEEAVSQ